MSAPGQKDKFTPELRILVASLLSFAVIILWAKFFGPKPSVQPTQANRPAQSAPATPGPATSPAANPSQATAAPATIAPASQAISSIGIPNMHFPAAQNRVCANPASLSISRCSASYGSGAHCQKVQYEVTLKRVHEPARKPDRTSRR